MVDAFYLYRSDTQESELAASLLRQYKIPFSEVNANEALVDKELSRVYFSPMFGCSTGESLVPALFALNGQPQNLPREAYLSFSGVRAFVRRKLKEDLGISYQPTPRSFVFYGGEKLVSCFNPSEQVEFTGPLDQAPHKIQPFLDMHGFKDWYDVSSINLRGLNYLVTRERGLSVNRRLDLLFFPYEMNMLVSGKPVVTSDSRSESHVSYTVYHVDEGNLFRIDAEAMD